MGWLQNFRELSVLDTPAGVSRRQRVALNTLNITVLIALAMIHLVFAEALGEPPMLVYILIGVRILVLLVEAAYLRSDDPRSSYPESRTFAAISISANLLFAFAVGYAADLHDSHYHVLMLLPIITSAFGLSLRWTLSTILAASTLTFLQLVFYFLRHPPFDDDEFFEAASMTVTYFVVGAVVWILVRQLRYDQQRLRKSVNELNDTQSLLISEEKLAAVGRLASAVAHEIRNPVAMIRSSLQLIDQSGQANDEVRREMIEIAQKETERLARLTTDFLNFARPRTPQRQLHSVRSTLEYAVSVVQHNATSRSQRCSVECPRDLQVDADPFQLHQLVVNLALNAIDASASGATICLRAQSDDNRNVLIIVSNPGPAIPREIQTRIFEPFFTSKQHGTGLGLAIARGIALAHGGDLYLAKNDADAVEFAFFLPFGLNKNGAPADHGAVAHH